MGLMNIWWTSDEHLMNRAYVNQAHMAVSFLCWQCFKPTSNILWSQAKLVPVTQTRNTKVNFLWTHLSILSFGIVQVNKSIEVLNDDLEFFIASNCFKSYLECVQKNGGAYLGTFKNFKNWRDPGPPATLIQNATFHSDIGKWVIFIFPPYTVSILLFIH